MTFKTLSTLILFSLLTSFFAHAETSTEVTPEVTKAITRRTFKKLNVNDYNKLLPPDEISKYASAPLIAMPKAGRVQLKAGLSSVYTDAFYNNNGLHVGLIYNLNETWGLGAAGTFLSNERNGMSRNIVDVQGQNIDAVMTLKSSSDVSLYVTPFYGKWSFLNEKILPYEFYLAVGAAQVQNQLNQNSSATTARLGHIISFSSRSALDVQLQGLFYKTTDINAAELNVNAVMLSVGYSFFWPQVEGRE